MQIHEKSLLNSIHLKLIFVYLNFINWKSEQFEVLSDTAIDFSFDPPDTAADEKMLVQFVLIGFGRFSPRQSQQLSSLQSVKLEAGSNLLIFTFQLLVEAST